MCPGVHHDRIIHREVFRLIVVLVPVLVVMRGPTPSAGSNGASVSDDHGLPQDGYLRHCAYLGGGSGYRVPHHGARGPVAGRRLR
eukprot:6638861-Pyramimonas_sp.AAC.1